MEAKRQMLIYCLSLQDAPYQRGIVWGPQKMSDLIDSLLFNFYVPPLVFSVRKVFMNNEIPYFDRSVDPPNPKYYSSDTDRNKTNGEIMFAGRQYLSDDEVIRFNQVELICVEYNQLTEDDEYDVFSRVQMGVQISPAEKLRAHNTEIAVKVRELSETYTDVSQILPSLGNLATLFKTIAEFFVCLDTEPGSFNLTPTKVTDYIKTRGVLKPGIVRRADRALSLLTKMINYHTSFIALTRHPAQLKKTMVKIELLTLLYYLSNCNQNRSLNELAEDCNEMRSMFSSWDQRLYLGLRSWTLGVGWCKQKWQANGQARHTLGGDNMVHDNANGFSQSSNFAFGSRPPIQYPPQNQYRTHQPFIQVSSDDEEEEEEYKPVQPLTGSNRRRPLNPNRSSDRPVAKRGEDIYIDKIGKTKMLV
ncbi:hypothetical protein K501DRAFT_333197 [Backusella circina FSU 941]|nr:hypothetical protein K501DRAFT_333197 [Backusella circina FSU 941]